MTFDTFCSGDNDHHHQRSSPMAAALYIDATNDDGASKRSL
jgi:hypothetical protein